MREPFSGAANPALDFVKHQQPVATVAERAQFPQKFNVGGADTSLALNRLEKHGADLGMTIARLFDRIDIVEGHPHKALHQGLEAFLDLLVAGCRKRGDGSAMEGALEHDGLGVGMAHSMAMLAREFEGGFVRFKSGIAEKGIGHARETYQFGRQLALQRHLVKIRGVDQQPELLAQAGHQAGVRMSQRVHRNAREPVEEATPFCIP